MPNLITKTIECAECEGTGALRVSFLGEYTNSPQALAQCLDCDGSGEVEVQVEAEVEADIDDTLPTEHLIRTTYWLMYEETAPLQAGGEHTSTQNHYGTSDRVMLEGELANWRANYVGSHYDNRLAASGYRINSAWIEVDRRYRLEV